jgi:hypothetical protein
MRRFHEFLSSILSQMISADFSVPKYHWNKVSSFRGETCRQTGNKTSPLCVYFMYFLKITHTFEQNSYTRQILGTATDVRSHQIVSISTTCESISSRHHFIVLIYSVALYLAPFFADVLTWPLIYADIGQLGMNHSDFCKSTVNLLQG